MQGSLQYLVEPALPRWGPGFANCPPLVFQDPDKALEKFQDDPMKLLDPCLVVLLGHRIYIEEEKKQRSMEKGYDACCRFYEKWTETVLTLPMEEANQVDADGRTCLSKVVTFLVEVAEMWDPEDAITMGSYFLDVAHPAAGKMAVQFVKEKLSAETVERTFETPSDDAKETLWSLIKKWVEKGWSRGLLSDFDYLEYGLEEGWGAEFMLALMEKGLPTWCWGGYAKDRRQNLLQHILAHPRGGYPDRAREPESRLCVELAKRFSLEELCHEDERGYNALYYAVNVFFHPERIVGAPDPLPAAFADAMKQQMEVRVRTFQGSLFELAAFTGSVRAALQGEVGGGKQCHCVCSLRIHH